MHATRAKDLDMDRAAATLPLAGLLLLDLLLWRQGCGLPG
jgi:hypothetical protein